MSLYVSTLVDDSLIVNQAYRSRVMIFQEVNTQDYLFCVRHVGFLM